jgi:hypothetical protein
VRHVQVPLTAPAGMSHVPAQQSAFAVQLPPVQTHGGWHVPLVAPAGTSHTWPGQQSTLVVQLTAHGGEHTPLVAPAGISHGPVQQSQVVVQLPPIPTQSGPQTPLVAPGGTSHVRPGQHSVLAVQPWPGAMHTQSAITDSALEVTA